MVISRGCVCWLDFGDPHGSAPALTRPAVVVQADALNQSDWKTTLVVPLTSNTSRAAVPGHVFVPASASGLPKDSVAVASQVVVVDKTQLESQTHSEQLPRYLIDDLEQALRLVLGL